MNNIENFRNYGKSKSNYCYNEFSLRFGKQNKNPILIYIYEFNKSIIISQGIIRINILLKVIIFHIIFINISFLFYIQNINAINIKFNNFKNILI